MGKKYIIELEDKPFHKGNGDFLYRVKGFNSLVFDMTGVGKLIPYTEPDLEQVRKEAYEQGYENGFVAGHLKAEKSGQSFYEDGYQRGLNDAWETARKIIHMPEGDLLNIFTECYSAVCTSVQVFLKYDASEAIEKIRQYEREKEEIKVGDEVIATSGKAVIVSINDNKDRARYIYPDSTLGFDNICNLSKTGRHFPEVSEVLEKIREE